MLKFIGLGLYDEKGLSLRGLFETKKVDLVFTELYTSVMPGFSVKNLEMMLGKKVIILSRADIEEKAEEIILERAKLGDVALLVPGDPMNATTHIDLRLRAEKMSIKTSVIHAASIASAICGATGLQSYKFGRTVTLPMVDGEIPESPNNWIQSNFQRGLHSLILLDLNTEKNAYMTIPYALQTLEQLEEKRKEGLFTQERLVIGIARIGSPNEEVKGGRFDELLKYDFGLPPHCLVLPGKLHFMEKEALRILAKVDEKFLREIT